MPDNLHSLTSMPLPNHADFTDWMHHEERLQGWRAVILLIETTYYEYQEVDCALTRINIDEKAVR